MRPTLPRLFLFALALILGQWLTLAHAGEHPALAPHDDAGCELCLHVHQLGAALPASSPAPLAAAGPVAFVVRATSAAHADATSDYPIRGPPRHS